MMLCPCCGREVLLGALKCACGGRFVGEPLSDPQTKIQRFGPAATAVLLLMLVVVLSLLVTKYIAFASVLVIWTAWRAMRLARRDPVGYGGFRTAAITLTITLVASLISAGFAINYLPRFLANRAARPNAQTYSAMYNFAHALDDYKRKYGGYPRDTVSFRKEIVGHLPKDYWNNTIFYEGSGAIAEVSVGGRSRTGPSSSVSGFPFDSFVLRSAGPDEKLNTDDDIVMRDGIFYTGAEARRLSLGQGPALR